MAFGAAIQCTLNDSTRTATDRLAKWTTISRVEYDFWIDNGIAVVGSPETVARRLEEQRQLIGHDIFCARHLFGYIDPDAAKRSIRLFAEEVMPAFA